MATTTNFGWETPDDTDLVKDGAAAIRTLGQAIDTSLADLEGGTTGQVLSKASNADMDFTWVTSDDANAIQNSIVDAKGDLIAATAADTPARLAVGTNGHVLTADSTAATGLKWAAPAGGGKILQVVQASKTDTFSMTSTSFTDVTGLSLSITPSSSSSKILILVNVQGNGTPSAAAPLHRLMRDSTAIAIGDSAGSRSRVTGQYFTTEPSALNAASMAFLDSPATTSATTYKVQMLSNSGSTVYMNRTSADTDSFAFGRGISTIIAMEVGA
jgi:hypothetical protein